MRLFEQFHALQQPHDKVTSAHTRLHSLQYKGKRSATEATTRPKKSMEKSVSDFHYVIYIIATEKCFTSDIFFLLAPVL